MKDKWAVLAYCRRLAAEQEKKNKGAKKHLLQVINKTQMKETDIVKRVFFQIKRGKKEMKRVLSL